jgi:hypothetical protein
MFYRGSDVVTNIAYAMTMFQDVYCGAWSVPKPSHMLLCGLLYGVTRDLFFVNMLFLIATALTVYAGCWLILRYYQSAVGCVAFCVLMMTIPRIFLATASGGPGCLNTFFLLAAIACVGKIHQTGFRILALVFLSLASLTRPDSWLSVSLIVLLILLLRLLPQDDSKVNKGALLFMIPIGMPFVWMLVNWAVFSDPLYFKTLVNEFKLRHGEAWPTVWHWTYPLYLSNAFFDAFALSSWLSARTAVLVILCLTGIVSMFRKQRRMLMLLSCPFFGTILFYCFKSNPSTRYDFMYYPFVVVALAASVGLGSLCGLVRHSRYRRLSRFIELSLACLILLFLVARPYKQRVIDYLIPVLESRAIVSKRAEEAIQSIVDDANRTDTVPIIVSTMAVPPSRIAIRLSRGENIFLVERLLAKENMGNQVLPSNLDGRIIYCIGRESAPKHLGDYLKRLVVKSKRNEVIYDKEGLLVLKCFY